jgi:hypothetical protein
MEVYFTELANVRCKYVALRPLGSQGFYPGRLTLLTLRHPIAHCSIMLRLAGADESSNGHSRCESYNQPRRRFYQS